MLQPQTAAEHQNDINDTSSSESSSSSSSSSESSDSEDETNNTDNGVGEKIGPSIADRRRTSHGSAQSLNFTSIFQSKRKRHRPSHLPSNAAAASAPTDLESGKTKHRDTVKEDKRANRLRSRPPSSVVAGGDYDGGLAGAVAMAAQSTLGTAIAGTGGSPVFHQSSSLSPKSRQSKATHSSPARILTSAARHIPPTPVTPLHVDTANYHHAYQQQPGKPTTGAPQFILGSIGENLGRNHEEDGDSSVMSTPRHLLNKSNNAFANKEIPIGDHFASSTPTSPNHEFAGGVNNLHPKTEDQWDLGGRNIGGPTKYVEPPNRLTANGGYVPKGIPLPEGVTLNKKRQIKFRRKLYEFFVAPITTFWAWTLSFLVFLCILTFVLLVRTPLKPTLLEWYLLAYVVAFGIEISRKFLMCGPKKLSEKFAYYFGNYWNFLTAVAIIGFIIGFVFRMNPSTSKSVGRIILAVDSVLWTVKLLDFLGVFPRFGPYITMAGKMIMNMSSIVVMLGISLLGFGLARQSITYPNEEWHWLLLRNVFYKPYFMLYGEVYADEIDTCGDEAWDEHLDKNVSIANAWTHRDARDRELACVPGHWIPPILMTVFLLIANILLISMLIAIFNNIFESTNKISQQIWLFQRYRQVMEYEATPFLPPPFTPVYHVYMIFKYLNYRNCRPCACFSPARRMLCTRNIFCCCLQKRKNDPAKGEGIECDEGNIIGNGGAGGSTKEKPPQLAKNAFEQRRNLQQERLALFDFSLKLFLTDDQVEKLHDFEEECMEDLAREKEYERNRTNEERLHRTCERTEMILLRVNDMATKETMLKGNVRELETRIEVMEDKQTEILEYLRQLSSVMPALVQSLQFMQQPATGMPRTQSPFHVDSSQMSITSAAADGAVPISEAGRIQMAKSDGHIFGGTQSVRDSMAKRGAKTGSELSTPALHASTSIDPNTASGAPQHAADLLLPPQTRQYRAQSYGNSFERNCGMLGPNSVGTSQSTVFYPLKGADSSSGGHLTPTGDIALQRRMRTTTIGGGTNFSPAFDGTDPANHSRHFGSLISLDPSLVMNTPGATSTTTIQPALIQSRRNTQRRHRLNDEYTSITDTINVEEVNIKIAQLAEGGESTSKQRFIEEEEDVQIGKRHRQVKDGMQTEEEEDFGNELEEEDEEDEMEEEEDEAEDEEEEEETASSKKSKLSPKRKSKQRAGSEESKTKTSKRPKQKHKSPMVAIEIDTASLCLEEEEETGSGRRATLTRSNSFDEEDDRASNMEEEFGQSIRTVDTEKEMDIDPPRAVTPNSALRRARSSFVRQHNTLFKSYEEDVGRPASKLLRRGISMGGATTNQPKKNRPAEDGMRRRQQEERGQKLREDVELDGISTSSSKDFISFKAQTNDDESSDQVASKQKQESSSK